MLARTGGDEFCLLLPAAMGHDEIANRVRERSSRAIADPYFIDGVGDLRLRHRRRQLLAARRRDAGGPAAARRKAALAEAKRATRRRARLFEPDARTGRTRPRAKLEMSLRAAIRDRRIGCAFQPKVDFRAGVVDSLEVLMRWRDEDGELELAGRLPRSRPQGRPDQRHHPAGVRGDDRLARRDRRDVLARPAHSASTSPREQAGDARFMRGFADRSRRDGPGASLRARTDGRGVPAREPVPVARAADAARDRRENFDRRFRLRLFLAFDARRHHRRRSQGRPLADRRHRPQAAQPEPAARDRVRSARRSARRSWSRASRPPTNSPISRDFTRHPRRAGLLSRPARSSLPAFVRQPPPLAPSRGPASRSGTARPRHSRTVERRSL